MLVPRRALALASLAAASMAADHHPYASIRLMIGTDLLTPDQEKPIHNDKEPRDILAFGLRRIDGKEVTLTIMFMRW